MAAILETEVKGSISGAPAQTIVRSAECRAAARHGSRATTAIRASERGERAVSEECPVAAVEDSMAEGAAGDVRSWL